jgi:hypothetical protein
MELFPIVKGIFAVDKNNSFLYGPVCVASEFRGQGVLAQLFDGIKANWCDRYPFGITFIDHRNARSLEAHGRKLGLTFLLDLPYDTTIYHVLGFPTRRRFELV